MKKLTLAFCIALLAAAGVPPAGAATTDIASVPVLNITGTGSIKPNIMLMMDNSGSMASDYTPDYVNDNNGSGTSGKCFDTATCAAAMPPYFAPEFNYQSYSPGILYTPGVDSTGASYGNQTTFTAVKSNPYNSTSTANLTTNYPDLVYCDSNSPASLTDTSHCRKNSAYTYPDPTGGTFIYAKTLNGNPYYYRITNWKYCSDFNLTNCIAATAPAGGYIYPAPVRWCTTATSNYAYTSCQRNFDTSHYTPEFIGTVKPASPSAAAYGVIGVATAGSQYSVTDMQVDGVSIINTTVTGTSAANFAANLATAINSSSFHSSPEYGACVGSRNADNSCSGSPNTTVTIFPETASCGTGATSISGCTAIIGTANNGRVITYSGPNAPATKATGTLTVGSAPAGNRPYALADVSAGNAAISSTGAISLTNDLSTAAGQNAAAAAIAAKIVGAGYSATASGNVVTITANTAGAVNNLALGFTSGAKGATGTLTVGAIAQSTSYQLDSISAGGTVISTGPISASSSSGTASTRQQAVASAIASAISLNGYSATASGGVVTITAPAGAAFNGLAISYVATPAIAAVGTLTVNAASAGSQAYTITNVKAGATTISTGTITFTADLSTAAGQQTAAAAIAAKIGNGYSASAAGGVVTVTANTAGSAGNQALSYTAPAATQASGSITVSAGAAGTKTYWINGVNAGSTTLSTGAFSFSADLSTAAGRQTAAAAIAANIGNGSAAASGVASLKAPAGLAGNGALTLSGATLASGTATLTVSSSSSSNKNMPTIQFGGTVVTTGGTCTGNNTTKMATCVAAAISSAGTNFTATSSSNVVTITPAAAGSYANGTLTATGGAITMTAAGSLSGGADTPIAVTTVAMAGGLNTVSLAASGLSGGANAPTAIPVQSTTNFTGGADSIPVASVSGLSGGTDGSFTAVLSVTNFNGGIDGNPKPIRMNVGTFTRTDILNNCPGGASDPCYPKDAARSDCAAATGCTYNEEMINFSNWYAYYRTRILTMKSAASLAFSPLGENYRVGFAKLSNIGYSPFSIDMPPADFTAANRATWYANLFATTTTSSTPLRTALDNLGKMYANKSPYTTASGSEVVQYPCQQNFVIMTTDGYWNQSYSGSVSNNDNTENASRFCTKAGGCFDGITSNPTVPSLADVALYWYNGGSNTSVATLRPDLESDLTKPGVVPAGPADPNTHLHMTTFTMGLGVSGYMTYEANYDTAPSAGGDYYKLLSGAGSCPWNSGGTYVWPNPVADAQTAVDDLWHAAVNGHGKYFSARDPAAVVSGLSAAIAAMAVRTGAASAAATSTPNVSQQDNDIFSATFTTVKWYGELFDQKIDPTTGNVSSTVTWSSSNTLGQQVATASDTRTIKMLDTTTGALKDFSYAAMSPTEQSWFDNKSGPAVVVGGIATAGMSQYSTLSAADKAIANDGNNLVNWFRGQTQYADDIIYRAYSYTTIGTPIPIVLGDIDTAKPAYIRDPRKKYPGSYPAFVLANAARPATVFAAANDGMLHAFNGATGSERWAYAPRITMSKLWKQAATNYGANHQFSTDGSPETADVQIGGVWKTVLVAGLNAGGRGYYALDVTDPTTPVALWEFCADSAICSTTHDDDLGLTFGNPQFGTWNNQWVVVVTSGYNNVSGTAGVSSGDGVGYLYILDVATGTVLKKISTGVGNSGTPSGFARITAITNNPQTDPKINYVYGGDNQGNLWRFDFNDPTFATIPVLKMATLGVGQPLTTRPDVALCQTSAGLKRVVLLGTGRLLGVSDTTTTGTQSVYLVKDSDTALGALNGKATMVPQVASVLAGSGGTLYTLSSPAPVNLATDDGWYLDLTLNLGERVNLDPKIVFSTAVVVSNLPISGSQCTVGGTSYNYQLDLCSGSYSDVTNKVIGGVLSNTSAAVGFIIVRLPSGTIKMITTTADGSKLTSSVKATASAAPRKSGWRSVRQ